MLEDNCLYKFEYNEDHTFPAKNTKNTDYWGYCNGSNQGQDYVCPVIVNETFYAGGNKEADPDYTNTGILNAITYPAGGTTRFYYENNKTEGNSFWQTEDVSEPCVAYSGEPRSLDDMEIRWDTIIIEYDTDVVIKGEICNWGDYHYDDGGLSPYHDCYLEAYSHPDGNYPLAFYSTDDMGNPYQPLVRWDDVPEYWYWTTEYTRSQELKLHPGIYLMRAESRIEGFEVAMSIEYQRKVLHTEGEKTVGGLRVSRIEGEQTIDYTYYEGLCLHEPRYWSLTWEHSASGPYAFAFIAQQSESKRTLSSFNNGYVFGYSEVHESYSDGSESIYYYYNSREVDLIESCPMAGQCPVWQNGLLLEKEVIDNNRSNIYHNYYQYRTYPMDGTIKGLVYNPGDNTLYHYQLPIYNPQLKKEISYQYYPNGEICTTTDRQYNRNYQCIRETICIGNDSLTKINRFASDFSDSNAQLMTEANMVVIPVETLSLRNGNVFSGTKTTYNSYGGHILPQSVALVNTATSSSLQNLQFETALSYNRYSKYGNPLSATYKDTPISYMWSYRGNNMIAEITNYGGSTQIFDNFLDQDSVRKEDLSLLRQNFNSITNPASITTCLYKPLVGVTERTSPEGITSYYQYDNAGRLSNVSSSDAQVHYSYDYHYRDSISLDNYVCATEYLNGQQSDYTRYYQYYDKWGRSSTSSVLGVNTNETYSYSLNTYNDRGLPARSYIMTPSQDFVSTDKNENDFRWLSLQSFNDTCSYSESKYDAIGRVTRTIMPGCAWRNNNKYAICHYYTNQAQDNIKRYRVVNDSLLLDNTWPSGTLACVMTVDPDGLSACQYKDLFGNVIMERKGDNIDTYYVYDDTNRLRYVLSPMYQDRPSKDLYAYYYKYDGRGNIIEKKLPGCTPINYWYDEGDRIICMQDGVLRANNLYRFFLYDQLGRLCIQGITPTCYEQLQFNRLSRTDMGPAFQFTGYAYFGHLSECSAADCEVEVVNYYDDYSFLSKFPALNLECIDGSILGLDYCESYQAYAQYGHAQLTGVWQRANNGEGILTTYVYDNLGQIVKQAEVGLGKRASVTEFTYNYVGDVTMAATNYYEYNDSNNTLEELLHANIQNNYDIPHTKLLSSSVLTLYDYRTGGSMTDTIQHFTYDDFGHITANDRGGTEADMAYSYDLLHGWLEGVASTGGFSQTLIRESHPSKPLYNGSISAMTWSVPGESTIRCYDYEYDGLNRLKVGRYSHLRIAATGGGPSLSPLSNIPSLFDKPFAVGQDYYTERIGYDLNSNITNLTRYGLTNSRRYDTIDDLSIEYEGNQLTSVSDEASPLVYDGASDFKDAITPVNEYGYNANGALIYDLNRGIRQIEYDHLGNMCRICFQESSGSGVRPVTRNTEYVYSADGRRLRTAHMERSMFIGASATMDSIDYLGNLILRNGVPDKYLFDGGYVSFDADTRLGVHYYIQDYMGNNRMVVNRDGTTEQITHYYPYGGVIGDISTNHSLQAYKFEGKELDRTFGLDWYDIQARQYDAIGVPRWTSMDPLAEKYYGISPYAYCGGDPVNRVDKNGRFTNSASAELNRKFQYLQPFEQVISPVVYEQENSTNPQLRWMYNTATYSETDGIIIEAHTKMSYADRQLVQETRNAIGSALVTASDVIGTTISSLETVAWGYSYFCPEVGLPFVASLETWGLAADATKFLGQVVKGDYKNAVIEGCTSTLLHSNSGKMDKLLKQGMLGETDVITLNLTGKAYEDAVIPLIEEELENKQQ